MSQSELAERMTQAEFKGFRQQTIVRIEAGQRAIRLGEAVALAQAVGSSIEALVRPKGLAAEAFTLRDLTRALRSAHEQATTQARVFASVHGRLSRTVARLEKAGHGEALEAELSVARRALELDLKDGE